MKYLFPEVHILSLCHLASEMSQSLLFPRTNERRFYLFGISLLVYVSCGDQTDFGHVIYVQVVQRAYDDHNNVILL